MAANAKPIANMTKNMTRFERVSREQAETETLPVRIYTSLKAPAYVNRDKSAKKYWKDTISRMAGITLLDDLDTEMLAVYCSMLSRRDALNDLCHQTLSNAEAGNLGSDKHLEAVSKLDSLMNKLQGQERTILQYADKLGLTPTGRVRLARKRAEARVVSAEDDLFCD